jgi:uncharacterized repeat protein (TIGR03803 family)
MKSCFFVRGIAFFVAMLGLTLASIGARVEATTTQPTYTILHKFSGEGSDGAEPGGLIFDHAGNLYGTTFGGGEHGLGTLYRIARDGTYEVLHSFAGGARDGGEPYGSLIVGNDGTVFGVTRSGGRSDSGTIFRITRNGTYRLLHSFEDADGTHPFEYLIIGKSGKLYGTTSVGGEHGRGTSYRLEPDGTGFEVLHSFTDTPGGQLVTDGAGNLYGTTPGGGDWNFGSVFRLAADGNSFKVLHSFAGQGNGSSPRAQLVLDKDGQLYGTADGGITPCVIAYYSEERGCGIVFKLGSDQRSFSVVHIFSGSGEDGANPNGVLILDTSGNIYGVASGFLCGFGGNCGSLFKFSAEGIFAVLRSNGLATNSDLLVDPAGDVYATTWYLGKTACMYTNRYPGCGTVFKATHDGVTSVLYQFCTELDCVDGLRPGRGLIADAEGNLYGTTPSGGEGGVIEGKGVVFKLSNTGFVTATPFRVFRAALEIDRGRSKDSLAFVAGFVLGSNNDGIEPASEPVTLTLGAFSVTIPAGSFQRYGPFLFGFDGEVGGVAIESRLVQTGTLRYVVAAKLKKADLDSVVSPVPVALTIGNDEGTASIEADIHSHHRHRPSEVRADD